MSTDGAEPIPPEGAGEAGGADGAGAEEILAEAGGWSAGMTAALVVGLGGFIALVGALIYSWIQNSSAEKSVVDMVGAESYDLELPLEALEYEDAKEKCGGDEIQLKRALMKRCVADVPMLQFMQGEERNVQRMYHSSMIGAASYASFQNAMAIAQDEMESVKEEADGIQPGWGDRIWQEGFQLHNFLKGKQAHESKMEAAEKEKKAAAKRAAKKAKEAEKKAATADADAEAKAQQAAEELLREADQGTKAKANGGLKQRKTSKTKKKKPAEAEK